MKADVSVIHGPGEVKGLPFSSAVRVGDLLFLSGQIGNVPGTRQLADGGITGQTRQVLENIKEVLAFAGSSLDRAVKFTGSPRFTGVDHGSCTFSRVATQISNPAPPTAPGRRELKNISRPSRLTDA